MEISNKFFASSKILVTGHTGFKGGWLSLWLKEMGASLAGFSLEPPTNPSFFVETGLRKIFSVSVEGDIRDLESLNDLMVRFKPDFVFHLAAQPIVVEGIKNPIETFNTNVMGTLNVLEAIRRSPTVSGAIIVTTDKVYDNKEWAWRYRENDELGGKDPYSSSKSCAELALHSYFETYFRDTNQVKIATARAGNVIGGGDWAPNRLIPDIFRGATTGARVTIRNPNARRPWQHVLEPLSGYLDLLEALDSERVENGGAWNFGPDEASEQSVAWVTQYLANQISGIEIYFEPEKKSKESKVLKLDSSKAKDLLGWQPKLTLEMSVDKTVDWHRAWVAKQDILDFSLHQIRSYAEEWQK